MTDKIDESYLLREGSGFMPLTVKDVISKSPFVVLEHQLDADLSVTNVTGDLTHIGWELAQSSFLSIPFRHHIWQDDFDELQTVLHNTLEQKQPFACVELRILNKKRIWMWIEASIAITYDDCLQPVTMLSYIKDVTQRRLTKQKSLELHEEYFLLFENNRAIQLLIDPDSQLIIRANRAARNFYGYSEEQMAQMPVASLNVFSTDEVIQQMRTAAKEGKANFETKHRLNDGSTKQVSVFIGPLFLKDKQLLYTIVFDVTEQKKAQQELRTLTSAIQSSASSIFITDTSGTIEYVNPRFSEVTGYTKEEVIGQKPSILKTEHTSLETHENLWNTIQSGEQWRGELYNRTKNGTCYWSLTTISPIHDDNDEISNFVAVSEDITDRINKYQHMERLALFDPLTHLANRRLLEQSLVDVKTRILREQECEDALVLMDLDGFKQVNDTYGHDVGDKLLQVIAERLQNSARATDLVCRLGGDEFAVVLRNMRTEESLANWCKNILVQLREPVEVIEGVIVQVSASIGAIQLIECLSEPSDWLREADELMYKVKQDGRNNFRLA